MLSTLRKVLPYPVKAFLRFLTYPEERSRFFRERVIKRHQDNNISTFDKRTESLILFFVPGANRKTGKETVSGGVISLVSICEETSKLEDIHDSKTIMCTFPRDYLLLKHVNFENEVDVYRFDQIVCYFQNIRKITIHLPDNLADLFLSALFKDEVKWLSKIKMLHINIVNANILLMPSLEKIKDLTRFSTKITMTTAHAKYCNLHFRNYYQMPLHMFSTWVSPEQYIFKDYPDKENVIVVSPDDNPERERILSILSKCEGLKIVVLQGLTHKEFKKTISIAKWALTFGEGLDGYLVEPIFSGSIAFAVYNEDFFTKDFKDLPGIYSSYDELALNIIDEIKRIDHRHIYQGYQRKQLELCSKYYGYSMYKENIRQFYLEDYTYK